jgi:PhzF family phenazine biosynthesis protein
MTDERIPLWVVDAFAERAFSGNPAAVCLLQRWPEVAWLASLAGEMNLSETAYLVPGDDLFELRWFTPAVEVDLCGHGTLASAFALWHAGRAAGDRPIRFSTRSGILTAARNDGGLIELDFPLKPAAEAPPPAGLCPALGVTPIFTGKSSFDWLVEVASEAELRAMQPDFSRLAEVPCRGVIVTAKSGQGEFDFVSRFFAPAAGVNEDPVTGSAHCTLADFWSRRLAKRELHAYQASKRGGVVSVRVRGDRVLLGGNGVLVSQGELAAAACP